MTDRYIDFDETQIYGPYAAGRIRKRVIGVLPAFDSGLEYCAGLLDEATAGVKSAMDKGGWSAAARDGGGGVGRRPDRRRRGALARARHSESAHSDRMEATPAMTRAYRSWTESYVAAKTQVQTVYRLAGRLSDVRSIFYDMTVPAGARVTEAPADA